ncbi:MAG: tRNA1(Val) (adenine(37)-N6)-methyltransferase [Cellulosilyticaceae bacterium]
MTLVNSNERIDDLQRKGYKLIQNPEVFCFGIDAVLLAHFAGMTKKTKHILDIGTGTGIIPILMHAMHERGQYVGIDVQEEMVDMANRSVKLNNIEQDIEMKHIDIKQYKQNFKPHQFDLVTCNPPYMKGTTGLKNDNHSKTIARHEVLCTLEDIIEAAAYVLKDKGKFAMIHRPQRLVDIMYGMKQNGIEPKRLQMVHGKANTAPTMVMVEGVRNGGSELRVDAPLIVYNNDNSYTNEILKIYDCEEKRR